MGEDTHSMAGNANAQSKQGSIHWKVMDIEDKGEEVLDLPQVIPLASPVVIGVDHVQDDNVNVIAPVDAPDVVHVDLNQVNAHDAACCC
ncbi:hypothetical protein K7X08_016993 [Anisodus acutangulus]|uniref:Uncharacterized protein n=1 Tax=Anisodus acutangulus TaxID=402998 RepID=A0A9Q1LTU5_9SOLA|nr:hypothetical protein K7X08_016993 [Anisodus acutangulus]